MSGWGTSGVESSCWCWGEDWLMIANRDDKAEEDGDGRKSFLMVTYKKYYTAI